jgi:hypothetical protein
VEFVVETVQLATILVLQLIAVPVQVQTGARGVKIFIYA